jgi:hypothetical protein
MFNAVRITRTVPDPDGINAPLTIMHKDVEDATWNGAYFFVTTSMCVDDDPAYRRLTRFKLNEEGTALLEEESVDLKQALLEALEANFGTEWYTRWIHEPFTTGGLNIEGLTVSRHDPNTLMFGLRGPLWGDHYGNPATDPQNDLADGEAIIALVTDPFGGQPSWEFETIDLAGHGVRSIGWIPPIRAYVLIGGPVPPGNVYSLWLWRPWCQQDTLEPLHLERFNQLCRPEAVTYLTENGKDYLVLFSEDGGGCQTTFIKAELVIECDPDFCFRTCSGCIVLANARCVGGGSFGFSYDPTAITVTDVVPSGVMASLPEGGPEYLTVTLNPVLDECEPSIQAGVGIAWQNDTLGDAEIGIGEDQEIFTIMWEEAQDRTATISPVEFVDCLKIDHGSPPIEITLLVEDGSVTPRTESGEIVIEGIFRRGDANGDGACDLSDSIAILLYLFVPGHEITCLDAADADDNGLITIGDAVYGLTYLFAGGDPPLAPGPDECGRDTTPDEFLCKTDQPEC